MRLRSRTGKKKSYIKLAATSFGIVLIICGLYTAILLRAPDKKPLSTIEQQAFLEKNPAPSKEQLIIPKIALKAPISDDGATALRSGAWHRFPERGNPEIGGNMILAAHRYRFAYTPQRVRAQSFFYNLPQLKVGDDIYVDWHAKRYQYKVTQLLDVKPDQINIEDASATPKLTIYTCTLAGSADGRVVVVAEPSSATN